MCTKLAQIWIILCVQIAIIKVKKMLSKLDKIEPQLTRTINLMNHQNLFIAPKYYTLTNHSNMQKLTSFLNHSSKIYHKIKQQNRDKKCTEYNHLDKVVRYTFIASTYTTVSLKHAKINKLFKSLFKNIPQNQAIKPRQKMYRIQPS
eukprot:TRINITY_DN4435_c1_g1_i1.p9 TRINITY_DN4435_c1_g1~~TRINITY_DN4435_c1_g1_i1.p9  ORF type:complete len:147 (+),score=0.04 TRINITY_DN4435_c1_g1_i1:655-1095(+)